VSSPSRSASRKGPIGAVPDSVTARSIAAIDRPSSSWARQISDMAELSTRLTTKPGTSAQVMGVLRIVWAKLTTACSVSGPVSSPSMISTSRMTAAG
jgi:hypothetical protein